MAQWPLIAGWDGADREIVDGLVGRGCIPTVSLE